ncbi:hypothetical protein [Streptomyces sp. NPDC005017]|uniref:hypothetical protein n=1 Tax=Streptomyces sp. NPDC005017 TaxID=3364706 RepID=UPI00369D415E
MDDRARFEPDVAARVFDRLMRDVVTEGIPRWDLASPYLRRHATEHAEECGRLQVLFRDLEFLVHADPTSVLTASALPQAAASGRMMLVYQASLARHGGSGPQARRHILAVDALRYGGPLVSERLYHPPHDSPAPWQCRWSTAQSISSALIGTLTRTSEPIHSLGLATSESRDFAVTAGDDHTAHVWDLGQGTLHGELSGHTAPLSALAVAATPAGVLAVTGDTHGSVRWWVALTGKPLGEIHGAHAGAVTDVLLSEADGVPVAVTCGADGTVRSWDLRARRPRHLLAKVATPAARPALVPGWEGEPVVVIGGHDGQVVAVDLITGEEVNRLSTGTSPVVALSALDDGGSPAVVLVTESGRGQVWELADSEPNSGWSWQHGAVSALSVIDTREDTVAVVAGANGAIEVRAVHDGRVLHTFTGHTGRVTALTAGFAVLVSTAGSSVPSVLGSRRRRPPDRRSELLASLSRWALVSGWEDGTLRVWDLGDGRLLHTLTAHQAAVRAIGVHSSGSSEPLVVSCGDDATSRLWRLPLSRGVAEATRRPRRTEALTAGRAAGRILIATACDDHRLRIFDASDGKLEKAYTIGGHSVTALGLGDTADGPVVVTATADGALVGRRTTSGEVLWRLPKSGHPVTALSAGGSVRRPVVVVLRADGQAQVHELGSGTPRTDRPAPGAIAIATGWIRGKPVAVLGHRGGRIDVWDLTSGQLRRSMSPATAELTAVAFGSTASGGGTIVSRHTDGIIRVWDADTGRPAAHIAGAGASAPTVATSAGGPVVVEVDTDGAVQFWDAATGEPRATVWLPEHADALGTAEGVVAVGYGQELAVLSASDDPGPWHDDPSEPKPTSRRGKRSALKRGKRRSNQLNEAVLAALQRRGAQDASELRKALRTKLPLGRVEAVLDALERRDLVRRMADSDWYQLSEAGRARLGRSTWIDHLPSRFGTRRTRSARY